MPVMVRRCPVPALCTSARARPPGKGGGAGRESELRLCSLLEMSNARFVVCQCSSIFVVMYVTLHKMYVPVCVFTSHPEVQRSKRAMHAICTHKAVHSVLVQLVWPAHVRLERAAVPDGGERVARGCRQARKGVAVCNKAQAAAPTAAAQWLQLATQRARGSAAPHNRGGGGTDEGPR